MICTLRCLLTTTSEAWLLKEALKQFVNDPSAEPKSMIPSTLFYLDSFVPSTTSVFDAYESHKPVLISVINQLHARKDKLVVVEVGVGYGSTVLFNSILSQNDTWYSIESDKNWCRILSRSFPPTQSHKWHCIGGEDEWYMFLRKFRQKMKLHHIDLLFIDSSTSPARTMALDMLGSISSIVAMHDSDSFPKGGFWGTEIKPYTSSIDVGYRDYSDVFKYWSEFYVRRRPNHGFYPPTLLGTNDIHLGDVIGRLQPKGCFATQRQEEEVV
jgi:hypothetical protein